MTKNDELRIANDASTSDVVVVVKQKMTNYERCLSPPPDVDANNGNGAEKVRKLNLK